MKLWMIAVTAYILAAGAMALAFLLVNKRIVAGKINEHLCEAKPYGKNLATRNSVILILLAPMAIIYHAYFKQPSVYDLAAVLCCFTLLEISALYDLKIRLVPNFVAVLIFIGKLVIIVIQRNSRFLGSILADSVIGLVACAVILLIASVIRKNSIGGGDIKLIASVGFMLGLERTCYLLIIGLVAAIAFFRIRASLKKKTEYIPLCPFIFAGFIVSLII